MSHTSPPHSKTFVANDRTSWSQVFYVHSIRTHRRHFQTCRWSYVGYITCRTRQNLVYILAVMHEIIFYHMGQTQITGEVSCFFMLHRICLAVEIFSKKTLPNRWQHRTLISRLMTIGFVLSTFECLIVSARG